MIVGFAIVIVLVALGFRWWGGTAHAKALLVPLLALGILLASIGVSMVASNSKRLAEFQQSYEQDRPAFVIAEKKRVEDFQYLYPMSLVMSLVCFLLTVGLLYFSASPTWGAWAVAIMLLGMAFVVIDYFSKERAEIYYQHLIQAIK